MTRILKKITMLVAGSAVSLSLFLHAGTIVDASYQEPIAEAQTDEGVSPQSDIIDWRVKVINGKLYKRLFNYSTGKWIGNWIPVG